MTDVSAAPPAAHPATYGDQLLTVFLTALGQVLVAKNVLSSAQLSAGVGDVVSLIGLAYGILAANPSHVSPLTWLMRVLGGAPRAQQATWNAAIGQAKAALLPELTAYVDAQIRARAGILAGPVDAVANVAVGQAAAQAAKAATIPQS